MLSEFCEYIWEGELSCAETLPKDSFGMFLIKDLIEGKSALMDIFVTLKVLETDNGYFPTTTSGLDCLERLNMIEVTKKTNDILITLTFFFKFCILQQYNDRASTVVAVMAVFRKLCSIGLPKSAVDGVVPINKNRVG